MSSFYELQEPTSWAEPPERYSFSSLHAIEACPRKWQLLHSEWGEHGRFPQRPHPKALEGTIIHEAIDMLVRALGKRGLPSISSPAFREAVAEVDFWGYFGREVARWNAQLARHPRSGPFFVIRTPPHVLANRAIRLFREQYTPLDAAPQVEQRGDAESSSVEPMALLEIRGALSEIGLSHPELPFHGIIDLVALTGGEVQIVDFKTGKQKDEHELQLQLYGVLWWRRTGVRPARLVVQYLNDRKEFVANDAELLAAEKCLEERIGEAQQLLAKPAEARPGKDCGYCPARARCDPGWRTYQTSLGRPRSGTTDIEVTIGTQPSRNGFIAEDGGREVNVVYEAVVGHHLPTLEVGGRIRILDIVVRDEGNTFEVRPWTEVYVLGVLDGSR
jgi:CRISPR/Cas system-associated exonuclease Cas4 (RecB family)